MYTSFLSLASQFLVKILFSKSTRSVLFFPTLFRVDMLIHNRVTLICYTLLLHFGFHHILVLFIYFQRRSMQKIMMVLGNQIIQRGVLRIVPSSSLLSCSHVPFSFPLPITFPFTTDSP